MDELGVTELGVRGLGNWLGMLNKVAANSCTKYIHDVLLHLRRK
jgi:hypothetical protein